MSNAKFEEVRMNNLIVPPQGYKIIRVTELCGLFGKVFRAVDFGLEYFVVLVKEF